MHECISYNKSSPVLGLSAGSGSSICWGNLSSQNDVGGTPVKTYKHERHLILLNNPKPRLSQEFTV